jgi:hypothetical protein
MHHLQQREAASSTVAEELQLEPLVVAGRPGPTPARQQCARIRNRYRTVDASNQGRPTSPRRRHRSSKLYFIMLCFLLKPRILNIFISSSHADFFRNPKGIIYMFDLEPFSDALDLVLESLCFARKDLLDVLVKVIPHDINKAARNTLRVRIV